MSMSSPGPPDWRPTLAINGISLQPLAFASTSLANADVKDASTPVDGEKPPKNKQKRNKPTLSCHECVERKTKCDRDRPRCHACVKRQTDCRYAHVASLLKETTGSASNGCRITTTSKKKYCSSGKPRIPNIADRGMLSDLRASSHGADALSIGLLSNVPYSLPSASNVFGIGSEHSFANYWTCEGGLHDAISVLPEKIQADILLSRYFECVDPVYPVIHRQTFYADYGYFWQLKQQEKISSTDPTFVALIFAMLALGTQFVTSTTPFQERKLTAEFYASASSQSLRLASYLSSASLRSIQAMVLLAYFLVNNNHTSDAWAFSGISIRQAHAMGLHRDPTIVTPDANLFEKQQRRKIWQAVLLQGTSLAVILSLPPPATHTDVSVEDPLDDSSSIAQSDPADAASWDPDRITAMAKTNKRVVRQTLFLTNNYFHNLMLVYASESPDVPANIHATLDAAHDAITAFFTFFSLFEIEACAWWGFNHRAFLEALCIGNVLRETALEPEGRNKVTGGPLLVRAKADVIRMIQIMKVMGEDSEVAKERVRILSDFLV
ncbi:Transcription factor yanR [Fusarium oxysporum f. sp. rapae]|uniref:Transcription factor yanR n=1 Tax=Fusarium oxysporum f. sp. rapae TaxID=485398 RepID=A0A8J5U3N6_FUSOX|nr:Transcription factor yanR [Fusarium oxysporum f. sp. rapae]